MERIAAAALAQPSDLFDVAGLDLAALRDPATGQVDELAVAAAVDQLLDARPGLAKDARRPTGWHNWGHSTAGPGQDLRMPTTSAGTSWGAAFRRAR